MMKKKVAVTGANGYIGRHVVKALLDMGAQVIAADLRTEDVDPRAKCVSGNIFEAQDPWATLEQPDAVLHMAWREGFVHNADAHMLMLSDHYRLVKQLIDGGVRQLAVMGTMHEVGYFEGAIDENTPCMPLSMYGIAKDSLRRATLLYAREKECQVQWLRCYYILGDDRHNHSVFTKLLAAAEAGEKTFPFNSGKNLYDFITVNALAWQIAASVMQTEVTGIINCCTGAPMSLAQRMEQFIAEQHLSIQLDYGKFPDRAYDSPGVWGNAEKIQKIMAAAGLPLLHA